MRRPLLVIAALVAAATSVASAERIELSEGTPTARLRGDGYALDLRMETVDQGGYTASTPVLSVIEGDETMLRIEGEPAGFDFPQGDVALAELDRSSDGREAVFQSFTGGAHCCTSVIVVRKAEGSYRTLDVGHFDGGGVTVEDLDGDGVAEFTGPDNSFLYAFDCYACSTAPLEILTIDGGSVKDISAEPRFLAAHRKWLADMEQRIAENGGEWSPGVWGGWLAAKTRVGEAEEAWSRFRAAYDPATDEGVSGCSVEADECPEGKWTTIPLPQAIRAHFTRNGFALPPS